VKYIAVYEVVEEGGGAVDYIISDAGLISQQLTAALCLQVGKSTDRTRISQSCRKFSSIGEDN